METFFSVNHIPRSSLEKSGTRIEAIEILILQSYTHPAIIAVEQFLAVQAEKKRRSNVVLDEFGEYHRAAQRYSMRKSQTDGLSTQGDDSSENDE